MCHIKYVVSFVVNLTDKNDWHIACLSGPKEYWTNMILGSITDRPNKAIDIVDSCVQIASLQISVIIFYYLYFYWNIEIL